MILCFKAHNCVYKRLWVSVYDLIKACANDLIKPLMFVLMKACANVLMNP